MPAPANHTDTHSTHPRPATGKGKHEGKDGGGQARPRQSINPSTHHKGNTPSPNDTSTHKGLLLNHLLTGATITPLEALDLYQCFALSQRLGELRRAGIPIRGELITLPSGKKIKRYWLEPCDITRLKHERGIN